MKYLSYKDILTLLENQNSLSIDERGKIIESILISPVLEVALEIHPIPTFADFYERTLNDLRRHYYYNSNQLSQFEYINKLRNVHLKLFMRPREDLKNRIANESYFKQHNDITRDQYKSELLQLISESKDLFMGLSAASKEGPNGEVNGIVEDFPNYVKYIFDKHAEGASGKEYLFSALKRIKDLNAELKANAIKLLLNTLNDARLAQTNKNGVRYSSMSGLSERLIDMFLLLLSAQVRHASDPWARQYYTTATGGFVVGKAPLTSSEYLQKMFLDAKDLY